MFGSFGILYIGKEILQLSTETLQTLVYLKLSIAGHLTIFATRTKKAFWTEKPAKILLIAVFSTQIIATLVAIFGLGLIAPIGFNYAVLVWGYSVGFLFITDAVKHLAYRLFNRHNLALSTKN